MELEKKKKKNLQRFFLFFVMILYLQKSTLLSGLALYEFFNFSAERFIVTMT